MNDSNDTEGNGKLVGTVAEFVWTGWYGFGRTPFSLGQHNPFPMPARPKVRRSDNPACLSSLREASSDKRSGPVPARWDRWKRFSLPVSTPHCPALTVHTYSRL
jgi:hypothetical protein